MVGIKLGMHLWINVGGIFKSFFNKFKLCKNKKVAKFNLSLNPSPYKERVWGEDGKIMTIHFNISEMKQRRRELRNNQTPAEKIMWEHLRNRKLLGIKFRRQYSVDYYVIDFYAPSLKLAIEIDGGIHNIPEQKEYDKIREEHIKNYGIKILRIKNEEIFENLHNVLSRIEETIKSISS